MTNTKFMETKNTLPPKLLAQLTPGTDLKKLQQVAEYVEKNGSVNISQIAKALNLTNTTARGYLEKMVQAGLVKEQTQGMARTFTWNRTLMDVGVVFLRALSPSAKATGWKGDGVDIAKFIILYPDKSGEEVNFWIAYSRKKRPMTVFVNRVKNLMAKLEKPRTVFIDAEGEEDKLLNSPLLDIVMSGGGQVGLQECALENMEGGLGNAYFAIITGNGYYFDFDSNESEFTLPTLYRLMSAFLKFEDDPFMERNFRDTVEKVLPGMRAAGFDIKEVEV